MKFTLAFDMDNDAFAQGWQLEVTRIVAKVTFQVVEGVIAAPIRDENGNLVGRWEVSD